MIFIWLDTKWPNSIFKESAKRLRQIKVIRYYSVIVFYAYLGENCFFSDKKCFIVFQNSLLTKTFFKSKDSWYFLLSLLSNLYKRFYAFCIVWLVWVLVSRYFVSSRDLRIIAFQKVFIICRAWLALINFVLSGACLFKTVVSNDL